MKPGAASPEMREYFGFSEMAHPEDARQWFEGLWQAPAV